MVPVVRIDEQVMTVLKRRAVEMDMVFATPNDVLRRILELDGTGSGPIVNPTVDEIEIQINKIYTARRWALLQIPRNKRDFFPGYKVPFGLETDAGVLTTHVTSAPKKTPKGDPNGGAYIQGQLRPWFDKHLELGDGTKLKIAAIERGKRYRLSLA